MHMSNEEILKRIISLISTISEAEEITEESEIIEDLGISSMDVLYLVSCMEVEFGVKIPERTVRSFVVVGDMVDAVASLL